MIRSTFLVLFSVGACVGQWFGVSLPSACHDGRSIHLCSSSLSRFLLANVNHMLCWNPNSSFDRNEHGQTRRRHNYFVIFNIYPFREGTCGVDKVFVLFYFVNVCLADRYVHCCNSSRRPRLFLFFFHLRALCALNPKFKINNN